MGLVVLSAMVIAVLLAMLLLGGRNERVLASMIGGVLLVCVVVIGIRLGT